MDVSTIREALADEPDESIEEPDGLAARLGRMALGPARAAARSGREALTGEAERAIDDTSVMRGITPRDIHHWHRTIRDAALVIADATLRPQTIATIVRLCRRYGVGLCLEPVSLALAPRIAPFLPDTTLITPNMLEAGVLSGLPVTNRDEALYAAPSIARPLRVSEAMPIYGATTSRDAPVATLH